MTSSRNYLGVREGISQDFSGSVSGADTKIPLGMSGAELTPSARDGALLAPRRGKIRLLPSCGKDLFDYPKV